MQRISNLFTWKIGTMLAVSFFVVAAGVLVLAPRQLDTVKADAGCPPISTDHAVFNPYSINDQVYGTNCYDASVIAVGDPNDSSSQWQTTINAQPGQTLRLRVYMHNGAPSNSGLVMHNASYSVNLDQSSGTSHSISATLSGNEDSKTGYVTINTPVGTTLQLVAGNLQQNIGDQQPCFNFSQAFYITIQVVGQQAPPAQGTGSISGNVGTVCSAQNLFDGKLTWTTANVPNAEVDLVNSQTGATQVFSGDLSGNNVDLPWIQPNVNYTFTLYNHDINSGTMTALSSVTLNTTQSCQQTPPPPAQGTGSISGNVGTVCSAQNLFDGKLTWTTNNVQNAEVDLVNSATGVTQVFSGDLSGNNVDLPWIAPNVNYTFTLYNNNLNTGAKTELAHAVLSTSQSCQQAPPAQAQGNISGTVGTVCSSQNLFDGKLNWTTTNVQNAEVDLVNPDTGALQVYSGLLNGTNQDAPWIGTGKNYTFILYNHDLSTGAKTELNRTTLSTSQTCGQTPPPANGNYSLTINSTNYCVGTIPSYTVTGDVSLVGQNILWSSFKSGNSSDVASHPTGEINASYGFVLTNRNGQAYWQAFGNPWTSNDIGYWIKTANVNGVQESTPVFQVRDCSTTPPPTLVCQDNGPTSVAPGQSVNFNVSGGQAPYTLIASGGNVNGTSVTFPNAGTYTVTVKDASGATVNCATVVVAQTQKPPLVCQAVGSTSVGVNQAVVFTANGGQSPYTFTSSGTANLNTSGGAVTATYASPGSYTITVRDVSGASINCGTVTVTQATPTLSCYANPTTAQTNQAVLFTAQGGSGNFTWSGGSNGSGSGPTYTTSFSNVGNQNVTVYSGNQSANCSVNITQPQQPTLPICVLQSPSTINGSSNNPSDVAYYAVSGGSGAYSWTAQNANPGSGSGSNFSTRFNAGVTFGSVSVTSNGQSANCPGVNIVIQQSQALSCYANPTTVNQGQAASFVATGGNGSYSWTGGSSGTGTGSNFTTTFGGVGSQSVTVTSGSQSANCSVFIQQPNNNGGNTTTNNNCVNYSCNTTTTTNNTTTTNTNNTNTNTNTNTYYYYTNISNPYTNPIPSNQYQQLGIQKLVRNVTNGASYQKTVNANVGDTVQFQVTVTNTGNQVVNNVYVTDNGVNGLQWMPNTTQVSGGNNNYNNNYNNNGYYNNYGYWNGGNLSLGSLTTGQSVTITFQAQVVAGSGTSIENVASAYGDNVPSRQDDAWVFVNGNGNVLGGNVNLVYSKQAWNDTKNANATTQPASKEDYITYTLTVTNNGNSPATNFVVTDDLSQVLPYADMVDNGGGSLSGNVISYPGVTVPAGGSVSEKFRVRVKYFLASNLNYVMTNTYGNTVTININSPQVAGAFTAPKTGADTLAFTFSGLMTAAFAVVRKRKHLMKIVLG